MARIDCGVICVACGKPVLFEDDGAGNEACTLLVADSYVCDECQEVADRAALKLSEDEFETWVEMMENGLKDMAALVSDHQDDEAEYEMNAFAPEGGEHEDWLDLQQTLEDARRA